MISFSASLTLSAIEERYQDIDGESGSTLRLPVQLNAAGIGLLPAIAQFIGTWARRQPEGCLLPPEGEETYETLVKTPHGFLAAYMAPRLADSNGNPIERNPVLRGAESLIRSMQSGALDNTGIDNGVFLACVAGARNEFLLPLYQLPTIERGLRGTQDFNSLTRSIVAACGGRLLQVAEERDIKAISSLVFELFENTNDHATRDARGRRYGWTYPNVRFIAARRISINSIEEANQLFKNDPIHRLFFGKALLVKPTVDRSSDKAEPQTEFFELAVSDFGPGIALRHMAKGGNESKREQLSPDLEREIVRSAFEFGESSKHMSGTGVGLNAVLAALGRLGALFRLRTGRLSLYQDFGNTSAQFDPSNWNRERNETCAAVGTTYTILIPLSRSKLK